MTPARWATWSAAVASSGSKVHVLTQRVTKSRKADVQPLDDARICRPIPQLADQPLAGEHLVAMDDQQSQQRPLMRTPKSEHTSIALDLERA